MSTSPVLTVSHLTKRFGGVHAVSDLSFDLNPGEALGIIGPNGSGKTTLVNLITGFVKPERGGQVVFRGRNITGLMPYDIANLGIARSFQMVRPFTHLPAYKNLVVSLFSPQVRKLKGGQYGDRDEMAIDLLEEVGFERDSFVPYKVAGSLPHGYLKRLELAQINLDAMFDHIARYQATTFFGVPAIFRMILEHDRVDQYDLSSLEYCFSGAMFCPAMSAGAGVKPLACPSIKAMARPKRRAAFP